MEFAHTSVLLKETIDSLQVKPDGIYADGTLGGGGHSLEIAKQLSPSGKLIGIDRDEAAIKAAGERLADYWGVVSIERGNFSQMREILGRHGIDAVDGIVLDLGVSSYQLDAAERGFSYMQDAPLDMRMDQRQARTAGDLINEADERELFRIIRDYGEERFAQNIAKHIVERRAEKRIETTGELVDIIRASIPMKLQKQGGHPAKRTFQAIRIELNGELTALEDSLDDLIDLLREGGRLSVITFHSLEDRIVKAAFKRNENPCTCPPQFPVCVCGKRPKGFAVTRRPVLPGEEEQERNPRSKSAKLRVFEKRTS